jgi:hypothetical protein
MQRHRRLAQHLGLLAAYCALSLAYFGSEHSPSAYLFGSGTDPFSFVWALAWWPWAIAHHTNPFVTKLLWYPTGLNLTWASSVPALAILGWPITAIWGAVTTFNVMTLLAPALGAWSAYLLAKRLTDDAFASAIGGYLYGFSAYEGGHILGHLNLDITVVPPLLILLSIERVTGERGRRSYCFLLAAALILQFGISTEMFATSCVFGAFVWAVLLPAVPPTIRRRMFLLPLDIAIAVAVVVVVVSPYLFYVLDGVKNLPPVINSPEAFSSDLLNLLVPTETTRLGRSVFLSISSRFPGNGAETDAYLGAPLLIIVIAFVVRNRRGRYAIPLLVVLVATIVSSLGPFLWVNGVQTHLPLPWKFTDHVPFLRSALPGRFALYVSLAAAVIAALWIAEWGSLRGRITRLAAGLVACAFLIPNPDAYHWIPVPFVPFFSPKTIATHLAKRENILLLPFGFTGPDMIWQWQAAFHFTQSGGYFGMTPPAEAHWPIVGRLPWGDPGPDFRNELLSFCVTHGIHHIVAGPGTQQRLLDALRSLGWPQESIEGVSLFTVPAGAQPSYYRIFGDYWGGTGWNWMGRTITIETVGHPLLLDLMGHAFGPSRSQIVVTEGESRQTLALSDGQVRTIAIPATGTIVIQSQSTFVPDALSHNGDTRALSILIRIR